MRSPGINGRGQPVNAGSPGKMTVKTECVCVCDIAVIIHITRTTHTVQTSATAGYLVYIQVP